ncbi:type VII secretion protein EccE [Mycolicibacter sp. MYC123]|uniref:Type VII secretion protein EccE n=1 Tax=[Mycobacterium] zoologicum TaxID=2872311 RepID=A0ABU5YTA5_9MYCO|nr:type VII secretion protein EccE [Mycolicibacter sp. MYC123]MEB3051953.1 type VII secretion protein EccE [Mycolicibacter sp. MYC123]
MRAQHTFGLNLSWMRVTTVFLIDLGILAIARHWPDQLGSAARAWWPGVGLAALVSLAALITHRRVPLTTVAAARLADRFADPATLLTQGRTAAFDHRRRYSRDVVGVRAYRGRLVTVIAAAPTPPSQHRRGPEPVTSLPAGLIAEHLRQFDVRLDSIDVVSVHTDEIDVLATGNTWLILRMDPMHNTDAVAVRDSVAATLAAATERLAHDLQECHIDTRVLEAAEFDQVDAAVLAGLQPARIRRRRRRLKQRQPEGPKHFATTFWVSPRDIDSANLEQLWEPDVDATAVTVRLAAQRGRTEVSVLARYHSTGRLRRKAWAGLNRFNGRQLAALRSSLPTPTRRMLAVPARTLERDEALAVPLGPAAREPLARIEVPA